MEGVTGCTVFRQIIVSVGKPDLFFTEFVNCDGLNVRRKSHLMPMLKFSEIEASTIALQNFGEFIRTNSPQASKWPFGWNSTQYGCPVRAVTKLKVCSALIQKTDHSAKEILGSR